MSQASSTSSIGDQNFAPAKDYTAIIVVAVVVVGLLIGMAIFRKKKS